MIRSVMLMLDWLGHKDEAKKIDQSVAHIIKEGKYKTYDMGGKHTSLEVAEAIAKHYESL